MKADGGVIVAAKRISREIFGWNVLRTTLVALASLVFLGACTTVEHGSSDDGALDVVLESDMALPKDLDHVNVLVTQSGHKLLSVDKDLGQGGLLLPATFEIKSTADASPVTIHAVGYKSDDPRIERDVITPIPAGHLGVVHLALNYLCVGTARAVADGGVSSTCPDALTCILGSCQSAKTKPSVPSTVGTGTTGEGDASPGAGCFDVARCFAHATPANVDPSNCVVTLPSGTDADTVNIALSSPPGGAGICTQASCRVSLTGWTRDGAKIQLPQAACDGGATIVVSADCNTQLPTTPPCGSWSSVTTPAEEPPPAQTGAIGESCVGASTQPCDQCGTQSRACMNGAWTPWGACTGQGPCAPTATKACGTGGTETCDDSCQWGSCVCPSGLLTCSKSGDCASPIDAHTCGACDHDCTALPNVASGASCSAAGRCSYQCSKGFADCGKNGLGCTTDLTDTANCGACGHDCAGLPHVAGATTCHDGECALTAASCAQGFADCNSDPSDGCETDVTAAEHCGGCGVAACPTDAPLCAPAPGGVACAPKCAASQTACDGKCVDTSTDASNCGACGVACPDAKSCVAGKCSGVCGPTQNHCDAQKPQSCGPDGQWQDSGTACDGAHTCVPATGKCGGVCGPSSTAVCNAQKPQICGPDGQWQDAPSACPVDRTCIVSTGTCGGVCGPGQASCSSQQPQVCDQTGKWTPNGAVCGANQTCTAGVCAGACGPNQMQSQACGTCNTGTQSRACGTDGTWGAWSACSGDTNLMTDGAHCGSCTNKCIGGVTCKAGACPCTAPASQTCGTCASGTQTSICNADGSVTWSACAGGANLQTDNANCGTCGHACASGSTCTAGACKCSAPATRPCGTCNTGTQSSTCNADGSVTWSACAGGANLQTDNANCGTCGNACASGVTCSAGVCPCTSQPCGHCGTTSCDSHGSATTTCTGQTPAPAGSATGGGYAFDDGTVQGWTVSGIYDGTGAVAGSSSSPPVIGTLNPATGTWSGATNYPGGFGADSSGDQNGSIIAVYDNGPPPQGGTHPAVDSTGNDWEQDLVSPAFSDSSPAQNHGTITFDVLDEMSQFSGTGPIKLQVVMQVTKCSGATSYFVDPNVFCSATFNQWVTCTFHIPLTAANQVSRVTNIRIRTFGVPVCGKSGCCCSDAIPYYAGPVLVDNVQFN